MNHLTVEDIINFVSLTELNSEALELCATVNSHIRKCEKCLKLVRAFQTIYDEFSRLQIGVDFKTYALESISAEILKGEVVMEASPELREHDNHM